MVKWSIPHKILQMQIRPVDLRSIGPPSQKWWPNLIFARFPHRNYNGWGGGGFSSKGRRHIWENTFSDIGFYRPEDQESTSVIMNFQNRCFCEKLQLTFLVVCSAHSSCCVQILSFHLQLKIGSNYILLRLGCNIKEEVHCNVTSVHFLLLQSLKTTAEPK